MSERKTILLRLSPQMWEDISKWADDEFRSINGQIEYILKEALKKHGRLKQDSKDSNSELVGCYWQLKSTIQTGCIFTNS
jgi:hypothetical protein